MSGTFDAIIATANETVRPVSEVMRHHFLEAVLRRLPVDKEPEFVLRGSMITRCWAAPFPRIANDLDFLGTFPHSIEDTAHRLLRALDTNRDDDVQFDLTRCMAKGIWENSAFPGVRMTLFAIVCGEPHATTVDIGFGDPLVPHAEIVEYPLVAGGRCPVWAVHRATMIGWKLHGLCEWGPVRWRPKDLLDLWLLTRTPLQAEPLGSAIRVAFESRGYDAALAKGTLSDAMWESSGQNAKWNRFCHDSHKVAVSVPEAIREVRDAVMERLAPALDLLDS